MRFLSNPATALQSLPTSRPLRPVSPSPGWSPDQWSRWTLQVLACSFAWFTSCFLGLVSLVPLAGLGVWAVFTESWSSLPVLAALVPYALVPAGAALSAGRGVVRSGPARPRLLLAASTLVLLLAGAAVSYAALLALGAVAIVGLVCAGFYLVFRLVFSEESVSVGEVWMVRVRNDNPSEPEPFKVRPSVVVEASGGRVVVLWSTTQTHRAGQRGYVEVTDLKGWPVSPGKRSFLNVRDPLTASRSDLVSKRGVLPAASRDRLASALSR